MYGVTRQVISLWLIPKSVHLQGEWQGEGVAWNVLEATMDLDLLQVLPQAVSQVESLFLSAPKKGRG